MVPLLIQQSSKKLQSRTTENTEDIFSAQRNHPLNSTYYILGNSEATGFY